MQHTSWYPWARFGLVSLFAMFAALPWVSRAAAQETGDIRELHWQRRYRIESQKVLNVTDLDTLSVKASMTVAVLSPCPLLTFGIDYSTIQSVRFDGREADHSLHGSLLSVTPSRPLKPGDRAVVEIDYLLEHSEEFKKSPCAVIDPFALPIDAVLDFPLEASYRVPPGYSVLTPGVLKKADYSDSGAMFTWEGRWRPRAFRSLLVPGKLHTRRIKEVDFFLAAAVEDPGKIDRLFDSISEVYFFMEDGYGARPAGRIAVAQSPAADEIDTRFNMGGVIGVQTSDFETPRDRWLLGCLAHEIAHEWWDGGLTVTSGDNHSVTEAMAEFSSIFFREKLFGHESAVQDVIVNTMAYLDGDRRAVSRTGDEIYSKAILIPRLLIHLIGEKNFFMAARELLEQSAGKPLSFRRLFELAEEAADQELMWILDWLYYSEMDLDLSLERVCFQEEQGTYRTTMILVDRVGRFDYPLDVPVEVTTRDGKVHGTSCRMDRQGSEITIETGSPVLSVALDPGWAIWDIDRSNNFHGSHVFASRTQPRGKGMTAHLVGGFKSRYDDDIWVSLWLHHEDGASLVPLPGPVVQHLPSLHWDPAGEELLILTGADPLRGWVVSFHDEDPDVVPLDPGSHRFGFLAKRLKDEIDQAMQNDFEEITGLLEKEDETLVQRALDRLDAYEVAQFRNPIVFNYVQPLFDVVKRNPSLEIRETAFSLLDLIISFHEEEAEPPLRRNIDLVLQTLESESGSLRSNAASVLYYAPDARAVEPLCRLLVEDPERVNFDALCALNAIGDRRAVPSLITLLGYPDLWDRVNAADALGRLNDRRAVEPLIRALEKEDPTTYTDMEKDGMTEDRDPARSAIVRALQGITGLKRLQKTEEWLDWWQEHGNKDE